MSMSKHNEPEPIVDYFERRMPVEVLPRLFREALVSYEKNVFYGTPIPEEDAGAAILLDLLAVHKGWLGYIDDVWDEFKSYVLEDVCPTATYASLRAIYNEVVRN